SAGGGTFRPRAGGGRGDGPSDKRTVWVLRDGRPQAVPIRIGMSDGSLTEVAEGDLHEGDALIVDATTSETPAEAPKGPGGGVRRLF
ncbi:MAG TPA: efflux RND transporter periplasmic adaptor subunit, partial [Polyangia bacterium]|nr:efflux RND transporter periplasmic adaptor subunit [Polyangia bacterium]